MSNNKSKDVALKLLQKIKQDLIALPNKIYRQTEKQLSLALTDFDQLNSDQLDHQLANLLTPSYCHLLKREQTGNLSVAETVLLHDIDQLDEMLIRE